MGGCGHTQFFWGVFLICGADDDAERAGRFGRCLREIGVPL